MTPLQAAVRAALTDPTLTPDARPRVAAALIEATALHAPDVEPFAWFRLLAGVRVEVCAR